MNDEPKEDKEDTAHHWFHSRRQVPKNQSSFGQTFFLIFHKFHNYYSFCLTKYWFALWIFLQLWTTIHLLFSYFRDLVQSCIKISYSCECVSGSDFSLSSSFISPETVWTGFLWEPIHGLLCYFLGFFPLDRGSILLFSCLHSRLSLTLSSFHGAIIELAMVPFSLVDYPSPVQFFTTNRYQHKTIILKSLEDIQQRVRNGFHQALDSWRVDHVCSFLGPTLVISLFIRLILYTTAKALMKRNSYLHGG